MCSVAQVMDEKKVKRRRTSSKHSQTGCKTCKTRHIKCDETRPQCRNCEKGDRACVYVSKSLKPHCPPLPPDPPTISKSSSITYSDQPLTFRPSLSRTPALPLPTTTTTRYPHEDIYNLSQASQFFNAASPLGSRRNSTPSSTSIAQSPQILQHPTTGTALVRNAVLVNTVQTQTTLQRAIHSLSRDFRLRGQQFTVETILSPLIHRSDALKHSVFANFILQEEQGNLTPSSLLQTQDLGSVHLQHYHRAINYLNQTHNNPDYIDANLGAHIILLFYTLCKRDTENWTLHSRNASELVRLRGRTLKTHPLSLHTKFLFYLYMQTDTAASNVLGEPANTDHEIARIVYSGVPLINRSILPARIELELLLAEISVFQYECETLLPLGGWPTPPQEDILRQKYERLLGRLRKWRGLNPALVAFEEAQVGEYPHGSLMPAEMGMPLLCTDQELADLWVLHCTAIVHVYSIAERLHIISHKPAEAQDFSILCCRIMSGMSIIDPLQPSVPLLWPLLNMSYGLTFDSGKLWVAEQLDSIATRYLNGTARIVAQHVRENIPQNQSLEFDNSARLLLPINSIPDTFVVPDIESWPSSSNELPYQAYITEDDTETSTSAAAAMSDSGVNPANDVFQSDLQAWDGSS